MESRKKSNASIAPAESSTRSDKEYPCSTKPDEKDSYMDSKIISINEVHQFSIWLHTYEIKSFFDLKWTKINQLCVYFHFYIILRFFVSWPILRSLFQLTSNCSLNVILLNHFIILLLLITFLLLLVLFFDIYFNSTFYLIHLLILFLVGCLFLDVWLLLINNTAHFLTLAHVRLLTLGRKRGSSWLTSRCSTMPLLIDEFLQTEIKHKT